MPLYTFRLYKADGVAGAFHVSTLTDDRATFATAGALLQEHLTCDLVEVSVGDRPAIARHLFEPLLRPVDETASLQSAEITSARRASQGGRGAPTYRP